MSKPTIVCMMKNEAPFILEWLAYHKVIGFKRFLIFSNDSTDGTTEILNRLHAAGEIEHIYHELKEDDVLDGLLPRLVSELNPFADGDWVIWLDADEFLNIHLGDGKVETLIRKINPAQGMTICWRLFGDSNQKIFNGRFISKDFTRCAKPGQSWKNVKTIFQVDDNFKTLFNHKPIMKDTFWKEGGKFVNPSGEALDPAGKYMRMWSTGRKRGKIDEGECSWEMAQINHYAVRTRALFQEKIARGSAGQNQKTENSRYGRRYLRDMNLNGAEDRTILGWETNVTDEIENLLTISDMKEIYFDLIARNYDSSVLKATGLLMPPQTPAKDPSLEYSEIINVKGIKIPFIKKVITPKIEFSMRKDRYEGSEIGLMRRVIAEHDRVLEIGAGIGAVSAAISSLGKAKQIVTIEANPELIPIIQETHRLNGTNDVKVINAVVSSGEAPALDFYCRNDFWSSSLEPDSRPYRDCIKINNLNIDDLLEDYNPTVIICDIGGGEIDLFDKANLLNVRDIILELHPRVYGKVGIEKITSTLANLGFIEGSKLSGNVQHFKNTNSVLKISSRSKSKLVKKESDLSTTNPRILIATCMKNEGPFILEWVAWQKAIGVSDIVVFTNDCSDGSDLLLDKLHEIGAAVHLPNPAFLNNSHSFQHHALKYAQSLTEFRKADYFFSIDVDEFLNIRVGDGTISALIEASGEFDALSICELNHGSNQREHFEPGWVMDLFPAHQTENPGNRKAHRGVKTLVKLTEKLKNIRNHRPDFNDDVENPVVWRDGSGELTDKFLNDSNANGMDPRGRYNLASLDHYALRSLDDYLAKMYRGDVVRKSHRVGPRYWRLRNGNSDSSSSLHRARKNAEKAYAAFLRDEELMLLHQKCCTNYAAAIEKVRNDELFVERRTLIRENNW